jgi:ATP-dependent DNA helicase RecQ
MVFIRINDPNRIERDSNNSGYSNSLLSKTLERHYLSNQIFDHFFLRSFSNIERWNFIEDFFLGSDVDSLIEKYKGGEANKIDIIETLKKKDLTPCEVRSNDDEDSNIHIFQPIPERYYNFNDLLTINIDGCDKTMKVTEWLCEDPVSFDKIRKEKKMKINKEVFDILVSKIKAHYPEYAKNALGLKRRISFKGYDNQVPALIPYSDQPIEFYKWWCSNEDNVILSLVEKIKLFDIVLMCKPTLLTYDHRKLINKI